MYKKSSLWLSLVTSSSATCTVQRIPHFDGVEPTENTEWQWPISGVDFIMMEKSAWLVRVGGMRPSPFPLVTITYKVAGSSWEGRDTLPIFHLYPICALWWGPWVRGGGGGRDPILGCHTTIISPPYPPHTLYGGPVRRSEILEQRWPYPCLLLHTRLAYQHIGIPVPRIPDMPLCTMYVMYVSYILLLAPGPYTSTIHVPVCITSSAVKLCNNRQRAMTSDLIHILISEIENMPLNMSCIV